MGSGYPGSIDSFATDRANATPNMDTQPGDHNNYADAINKIEATLGVNPQASSGTVAARLAAGLLPSWWTVASTPPNELLTMGGGLTLQMQSTAIGMKIKEFDTSNFQKAFSVDASAGQAGVALFTNSYPLDAARREGVVYVNGTDDAGNEDATFIIYGGGNFAAFFDNSVVWPITITENFGPGNKALWVNADGTLIFRGAETTANLAAGDVSLWLDSTNGASKLNITAKSANGTVVRGSVALS